MSQRQLDVQHDEVKRRNRDQRLATLAEAEKLRAARRARCGR